MPGFMPGIHVFFLRTIGQIGRIRPGWACR
jgi:hypothetical protein